MTRVLVVNTGSSSLKLTVLEGAHPDPVAALHVEDWDGSDVEPVRSLVEAVDAVGHRVVHGGTDMTEATLIDPSVIARIEALTPLAPLHQPRALAGIRAATAALPEVPQVACFDTAFHATLPAAARTYALPAAWRDRWDLRRFGFHGLSHAWAVSQVGDPDARVVSCHLGAGASLCAARGGRSVDTTMGFTPLEGLVMATRAGSVDPGLILWLLTEAGLTAAEVTDALESASGLAGLAGTADMREIVARDDPAAHLALDVYVHRLCREIGAMTASLGGLDVLVFTGGVGENSAAVRDATVARLDHLTPFTIRVVEAREDLEITRQVRSVT